MTRHLLPVALGLTLLASACTTPRPERGLDHPANPSAPAGVAPLGSATAAAVASPGATPPEDEGGGAPHHHHGGGH